MQTNERPKYVTQINAFHRFTEGHYLSANAQLLWFKLMNLFNVCGWPEWVQADANRIMHWIGAGNVKAVYRARDALVKAGLLEYVKGHKGCPNRYRMRYFAQEPYGKNESKNDSENDSKNDTENDSENDREYDG